MKRRVRNRLYDTAFRFRPYYQSTALQVIKSLKLQFVLRESRVRRLLLTPDDPRYRRIFQTKPLKINGDGLFELHMLLCEKDLLRGVWSLKSFFHYSQLDPHLVIHDDGSLSPDSLDKLREHFVGCRITSDSDDFVFAHLEGYPACLFFRRRHFVARKLFDVLLHARSDYVMVMDSDILWFSRSLPIVEAVRGRAPFYIDSGTDSYARNRRFMETHCNLVPARDLNSGLVGFLRNSFFDLPFIEEALDKLVNVPPALLPSSIGYVCPWNPPQRIDDPIESICWWVMEQTVYALLFGRELSTVVLSVNSSDGQKAHSFGPDPITADTALRHFISDASWNGLFPIGAEVLIETGMLEALGTSAY